MNCKQDKNTEIHNRATIVKMLKVKDQEKILNETREKQHNKPKEVEGRK